MLGSKLANGSSLDSANMDTMYAPWGWFAIFSSNVVRISNVLLQMQSSTSAIVVRCGDYRDQELSWTQQIWAKSGKQCPSADWCLKRGEVQAWRWYYRGWLCSDTCQCLRWENKRWTGCANCFKVEDIEGLSIQMGQSTGKQRLKSIKLTRLVLLREIKMSKHTIETKRTKQWLESSDEIWNIP